MRRAVLLALTGALGGAGLAAQEPEAVPRYGAASGCFAYAERVLATTRSEAGGRRREVTVEREGRLLLAVSPAAGGLAIEAWYDSLVLRVRAPEGEAAPDASGLLGGRWRGVLDSAGTWHESARPFIPDEVAAVMDLGPLLEDFLPHGPAHRVIARDDSLDTGRGRLAARTVGDEGRTLAWGDGPLPAAWERHLETVTTATDGDRVLARIRLTRAAHVALVQAGCGAD